MSGAALRRIPARYRMPVTSLMLTGIMTLIVSGISTALALGISGDTLGAWPFAWVSSWLVAFPTMLVVLPIVQWIVARIVSPS